MPPRKRDRAAGAESSRGGELSHDFGAFTDLRARTNAGDEITFDVFSGKLTLVVNVARL